MTLSVTWIDGKREPACPPDPKYPDGIDIDLSFGAVKTCATTLPCPAKRCGTYIVKCEACGKVVALTTAGRPDNPRSLKVACRPVWKPDNEETVH